MVLKAFKIQITPIKNLINGEKIENFYEKKF